MATAVSAEQAAAPTNTSPVAASVSPPVVVAKPDTKHYDELIKVETDAVERLKKEISALTDLIAKGSGMNRDEFRRQTDEQRAKIADITQRLNALTQERDVLQEKSNHALQHGRNLRSQVESLQRSLGFTTVEEIDKRIKEIEYEMIVTNLSLKEEKALIADIEKLKKAKPEIQRIHEMNEAATASEGLGSSGFRDRLQGIRDQINELRDARAAEQDKLTDLQAEWQKQQAPLNDLWEKRDGLRREMGVHQGKANQLISEKLTKETEYRAYLARNKSARMEIERWERQYSLVENDKHVVQQDIHAIPNSLRDPKSFLAQQVVSYLRQQIALYEEATSADSQTHSGDEPLPAGATGTDSSIEQIATPGAEQIIEDDDGQKFVVLDRKKVETFAVGSKKGKKGGKRKQAKEAAKPVSDKLPHTFETLKDFARLGFDKDYPMVVGDCPKAIERLEAFIEQQTKHNASVEEANKKKLTNLEARLAALNEKQEKLLATKPAGAKIPKPKTEPETRPSR